MAGTSSLSQILHPAGKKMLTTASLASASHPRTPLRDARATAKQEPSPITPEEIYPSPFYIERENVR
jgi:hypothetical protein